MRRWHIWRSVPAWLFSFEVLRAGLQVGLTRIHDQLRLLRRLVRRVDAGEALNLAGAGLLIQTLRIALLAYRQIRLDVHFKETPLGHDLARDVAILAVRRDERRHGNHARLEEQLQNTRGLVQSYVQLAEVARAFGDETKSLDYAFQFRFCLSLLALLLHKQTSFARSRQ